MSASASRKVIFAALLGNTLIAITKFVASFITGSSAMLSEAIHSVVDTGNQLLLLFALKQAKKPPSPRFPFGHGKEVYFWSFIVAIMIFAVGAGISIYEGIHHILDPVEVESPMVNYIVLALATVFEGAAWFYALREFRKAKGNHGYLEAVHRGKDPTLFIVLFEDTAAMLGLLVAFIGLLVSQVTGNPVFDGIASVVIGVILGTTAAWLAYETKSLLIGESAHPEVVADIRNLIQEENAAEYVNEVLTMHMGPEYVLANISVDFKDTLSAEEIENCISRWDKAIKVAHPEIKRVFIEAERHRVKTPPANA